MKLVGSFELTVPDGIPLAKVQNHLNDALSIGTEQLNEDSDLAMDGILGQVTVKVL